MAVNYDELKLKGTNGEGVAEIADQAIAFVLKQLWKDEIIPEHYEEVADGSIDGALQVVADSMSDGDFDASTMVRKSTLTALDEKFNDIADDGTKYVKLIPQTTTKKEIYLKSASAEALSKIDMDEKGNIVINGKKIPDDFFDMYDSTVDGQMDSIQNATAKDLYLDRENKNAYIYNGTTNSWDFLFYFGLKKEDVFKEVTTPEHHETVDPTPSKPSESVLEVVPNDTDPIDPNTQIKKDDLPPELSDVNVGDKVIKDDPQDGSDPTYKKPTADNYPDGSKEVVPDDQNPYDPNTQIKESEVKPLPGGDPIVPGDHVILVPEEKKDVPKYTTPEDVKDLLEESKKDEATWLSKQDIKDIWADRIANNTFFD